MLGIYSRLAASILSPVLYRVQTSVEGAFANITPERWQQILLVISQVFRPVFTAVDWIRLGLVKLYIQDRHCFAALRVETAAVSSIVYRHKNTVKSAHTWTPEPGAGQQTVAPLFGILLILTPLFWLVDILRVQLVNLSHPELRDPLNDRFNAIWAYTFGGAPH